MHPNATIHNVDQGSDEWYAARNGIITASEMNLILTPTLKKSDNAKTRAQVWEIAAQRIAGFTEPTYIGWNGERGHIDEVKAREAYNDHYEPVEELGFVTREIEGVTLGYSPDGAGIMGNFGIECKSRVIKYQVETIVSNEVPVDHILQVQAGLMVTGWDYIDYISYSAGLPMWVIRVEPEEKYQSAIIEAAVDFEAKVQEKVAEYMDRIKCVDVLIETEREEPEQEVYLG